MRKTKAQQADYLSRLVRRARIIQTQLDTVKPLYNERERIINALIATGADLSPYGVVLVDKFADKNTQFKCVAISRWELEVTRKGRL